MANLRLLGVALLSLCFGLCQPLIAAETLPAELSDHDFWQMILTFSEPGGSFTSENFLSNENTFQRVIPMLKATTKTGGVYLGVGPEQNFTYIAAIRPRIAFIIDIRRQNMLQHLMYKATFELSENRADFLSRLFSRPRPRGLDPESSPQALFAAFKDTPQDKDLFERNFKELWDHLTTHHQFELSVEDKERLHHVYISFFAAGPGLSYSFGAGNVGSTPSYADLMAESDGRGKNWSYLSNEENFRIVKELETKNLLIPLVGDFAGPKAIRKVAQYLNDRQAPVTAFYTSNVERYLFEEDDNWKTFYKNVEQLPLDRSSTFIRAVLNARPFSNRRRPAIRSTTLISSMQEVLHAIDSGDITQYDELNALSK